MTALPRVLVPIAILALALVPTPLAAATDCVELVVLTAAAGLRLFASTDETIAFGFQSGSPGDGVRLVALINTVACGGIGTGSGSSSAPPGLPVGPGLLPLP